MASAVAPRAAPVAEAVRRLQRRASPPAGCSCAALAAAGASTAVSCCPTTPTGPACWRPWRPPAPRAHRHARLRADPLVRYFAEQGLDAGAVPAPKYGDEAAGDPGGGRMKAFAALFTELDTTTSTKAQDRGAGGLLAARRLAADAAWALVRAGRRQATPDRAHRADPVHRPRDGRHPRVAVRRKLRRGGRPRRDGGPHPAARRAGGGDAAARVDAGAPDRAARPAARRRWPPRCAAGGTNSTRPAASC